MPSTVEISRNGLLEFCTDGCQALGKFWCGEAIARQALLIQPTELLQLTGLQALQIAVDGLDGGLDPISMI